MLQQKVNIVWLKRDLRTQDHLPLKMAEDAALSYIIIFIFEPSIIALPDTSLRHLQFQYHSLQKMDLALASYNTSIVIMHCEAVVAFEAIKNQYTINQVFSYQESGIEATFARDKLLKKWFISHQIIWQEFQRDGIIRGSKNREGWDKNWYITMHSPLLENNYTLGKTVSFLNNYFLPNDFVVTLENYPKTFQPAGEENANKYLKSFAEDRGKNYSRHISKPQESRTSCGRISPYLAWGNISIKQAYQFVFNSLKDSSNSFAFKNFLTRLKWHCHFIQKFEVECSYETQCVNKGFELMQHNTNESYIEAWKTGTTGFPLVDACMRCLQHTGWINFRMRAMLVSFFCHNLFQDWRQGTYHLANLFLDYEPGIHYPQFQMQAGTTGINTIRMYNPIKQSQDHDPKGMFIKKWIPELGAVSETNIHEPWKMTTLDQQLCNTIIGETYPNPIVDVATSAKIAKDAIWNHRKNIEVKLDNKRIITTHTRNNQLPKKKKSETNKKTTPPPKDLFSV
jgi:deoxyribodipyrimidine photo-lyase